MSLRMDAKRVSTGYKLIIYATFFVAICIGIEILTLPVPGEQFEIWRRAASWFGNDDLEGVILLTLFFTNLVLATLCYRFTVRYFERRMNGPI